MENNLVLYRKYRPQKFSEVVGQEHVVKTLTNAIAAGMISHAYLFAGPRGTGKTTLARLLAKAINCQNRREGTYEPCNQCESCLEIQKGISMDLIEIDAASNRGIDEIRDLKEGIRFAPTKSKYKVFIVDESHQLTKEAANALLKTLEEPPPHVVFILATTEVHKMIPTILSRCQRFDFRRLKIPEIVKRLETILKQEKIDFEPEALQIIAQLAEGSIRDAESLLAQAISFVGEDGKIEKNEVLTLLGIADTTIVLKFLEYLAQNKQKEAIEFVNEIIYKGIDLQEFIKSTIRFLREILLFKINPNFQTSFVLEKKEELEKLVNEFSQKKIQNIIEKLLKAQEEMKFASILQLPLELAIIEICNEN